MNLNQVTAPSTGVACYGRLGLRLIVDALPDYARFVWLGDEKTHSAPSGGYFAFRSFCSCPAILTARRFNESD